MKKKGKAPIQEHVERPIKKKATFKAKETQNMLQWIKMSANKLKWAK